MSRDAVLPRLYVLAERTIDLNKLSCVEHHIGDDHTSSCSFSYVLDGEKYYTELHGRKRTEEARDALIKAWGGPSEKESLEEVWMPG